MSPVNVAVKLEVFMLVTVDDELLTVMLKSVVELLTVMLKSIVELKFIGSVYT